MMMTLGFFVFTLPTANYNSLQRQTDWRHAEQQRIGARPVYQFLGHSGDRITLSGVLMPEVTGGRMPLDLLRVMAEEGKAWPLLEGTGRYYGFFAIESINETSSEFLIDGMPQKITFTMNLLRVDDKKLDLLSAGLSAATAALTGIAAAPLNNLRGSVNKLGNKFNRLP